MYETKNINEEEFDALRISFLTLNTARDLTAGIPDEVRTDMEDSSRRKIDNILERRPGITTKPLVSLDINQDKVLDLDDGNGPLDTPDESNLSTNSITKSVEDPIEKEKVLSPQVLAKIEKFNEEQSTMDPIFRANNIEEIFQAAKKDISGITLHYLADHHFELTQSAIYESHKIFFLPVAIKAGIERGLAKTSATLISMQPKSRHEYLIKYCLDNKLTTKALKETLPELLKIKLNKKGEEISESKLPHSTTEIPSNNLETVMDKKTPVKVVKTVQREVYSKYKMQILYIITDDMEVDLDHLEEQTKIPRGDISHTLSRLKERGFIKFIPYPSESLPGHYYRLCEPPEVNGMTKGDREIYNDIRRRVLQ